MKELSLILLLILGRIRINRSRDVLDTKARQEIIKTVNQLIE